MPMRSMRSLFTKFIWYQLSSSRACAWECFFRALSSM